MTGLRLGGGAATLSGKSSTDGAFPSWPGEGAGSVVPRWGSFRITAGTSGRGAISVTSVELALFYLSDVGDEVGLDASGLLQDIGKAAKELVVRNGLERALVFHEGNIGPAFSRPWEDCWRSQAARVVREGSRVDGGACSSSPGRRHALTQVAFALSEDAPKSCQGESWRKRRRSRAPASVNTHKEQHNLGGAVVVFLRPLCMEALELR
jgi:hypothetical protein